MNENRDNPVSINIFEQINAICKDFRRALRSGQSPRIEDWLNRIGAKAQTTLFSNLLEIEVNHRLRNGQSSVSGEYLNRFPKFASQVRQAFDESTTGSIDNLAGGAPRDSSGPDITLTFEILAANRLGDYELVRELGRGGFGVVYEARHLRRNNRVALKTLPTGVDGQELNAERLHRFRKEFRSLSEINHPNLVGMQTLEVHGGQWFFTMDLIKGENFLSYVRPNDELNETRLRDSLKKLVSGIIALHERKIVHRDLKPSNILVDAYGKVTILDFGLVAQLQTPTDLTVSKSEMFAGTPRYAAPEQLFGERSEASDWYAVGVMLYEALTGEPPFRGKQMELLRQKQNEEPPRLTERNDLATDLALLADGLLKQEPKKRLTTQAIIEALAHDLESTTHRSATVDDDLDVDAFDEETILIGREEQLAQLDAAKHELLDKREPVVVTISGRSGEGKSSLVQEFLRPIRYGTEMLVLSGRCYDRESVPYKAIDSLIDALSAFLRSRNPDQARSLLPSDVHMLAHVFPLLKRVIPIAEMPSSDFTNIESAKLRQRAFFALRELLVNISRDTPVMILIDDLQWGDADSAQVLFSLLVPPDTPAILFLGSFRSDETANSPFLREWERVRVKSSIHVSQHEVVVGPLSEEECLEFLLLKYGDSPEVRHRASELHRSTGGNPYFLDQLLEGFDATTGKLTSVPLEQIISTKLDRLSDDATPLLNLIAVSGKAISVDDVSQGTGLALSPLATLTRMRSERLVRLIGSPDQTFVDTYHDKIRETVLGRLSGDENRRIHLQIAEAIEKREPVNVDKMLGQISEDLPWDHQQLRCPIRGFDLAYHFSAAGNAKAFACQLLAGNESARAYAMDDARRYLENANGIMPDNCPDAIKYWLWGTLGEICTQQAESDNALGFFDQAAKVAGSKLQQARVQLGKGLVFQQTGRLSKALESFDQALISLGRKRPRTLVGILLSCSWSAILFLVVPARWQKLTDAHSKSIAEMEFKLCDSLMPWQFEVEPAIRHMLQSTMRLGVVANQCGDTLRRAIALGQWAAIAAYAGVYFAGRRWLRQSEKLRKTTADPQMDAILNIKCGLFEWISCRFHESILHFNNALKSLRKCGTPYDFLFVYHAIEHVQSVHGSSRDELKTAQLELEAARQAQTLQGLVWAHYALANASARAGRLNKARLHINHSLGTLANENWIATGCYCHHRHAFVLLQSSDYEQASIEAAKSWQIACENHQYSLFTVPGLCLLIESLTGPNWRFEKDESSVAELKKLSKKVQSFYRQIPILRPAIQRARGRALWVLGHEKSSQQCFERGVQDAQKLDTGLEQARALLDLAAVKEQGREENIAEAIELLKKMESVIPRAESWLLGDQYDEAVVAPEFDLEACEREHGKVSTNNEPNE